MEKLEPHYDLGTIRATFCVGKPSALPARLTSPPRSLGMTRDDIIACIQGTTRTQFYKSMTSAADSRVWQDVDHVPYSGTVLYVKFMRDAEGYLLISLKERRYVEETENSTLSRMRGDDGL